MALQSPWTHPIIHDISIFFFLQEHASIYIRHIYWEANPMIDWMASYADWVAFREIVKIIYLSITIRGWVC